TALQLPSVPNGSRHVYHLYVIQTEGRDRLMEKLKKNGIETAIHYPCPLPLLKAYKAQGYTESEYSNADRAAKGILSIPMYPELTKAMIQQVCKSLEEKITAQ